MPKYLVTQDKMALLAFREGASYQSANNWTTWPPQASIYTAQDAKAAAEAWGYSQDPADSTKHFVFVLGTDDAVYDTYMVEWSATGSYECWLADHVVREGVESIQATPCPIPDPPLSVAFMLREQGSAYAEGHLLYLAHNTIADRRPLSECAVYVRAVSLDDSGCLDMSGALETHLRAPVTYTTWAQLPQNVSVAFLNRAETLVRCQLAAASAQAQHAAQVANTLEGYLGEAPREVPPCGKVEVDSRARDLRAATARYFQAGRRYRYGPHTYLACQLPVAHGYGLILIIPEGSHAGAPFNMSRDDLFHHFEALP